MKPSAWVLVSSLGLATAAVAQAPHSHDHSAKTPQAATALSEGEVRKVDKEARKITLKHGRIENLDMPPMTMVFQVKDAALLESVRQGEKVKFAAEKVGGGYVVTRIEAAR